MQDSISPMKIERIIKVNIGEALEDISPLSVVVVENAMD